jgi:nicotinamide-nucleotide amidase
MATTEAKCKQMIESTRAEILELVGDLHFGDGEKYEQYHAIDDLLTERSENLLVVELGFAAPLGDWFASLGQTPSYRGGLSFAGTDDLMRLTLCEDPKSSLQELRRRFKADWLLMVDQYPSLESTDGGPLPAAQVHLVVICPDGRKMTSTTMMGGHPAILQQRIGKAAMAWLRKVVASL